MALDALTDTVKITFGTEMFSELAQFLKTRKYSSIFILVDENTLQYCVPEIIAKVPKLLEAEIIELESGEVNKNIEVCTQVWTALGDLGADRNSLLINVGGGVITDLGGFVAATFKRGISFINIPTTLLAQVDASVGGKTGVDLGILKNEVGVFANPEQLFIYTGFLRTLPERELKSGLAEVLKHGLIASEEYWNTCAELNLEDVGCLEEIIRESVAIKATVVNSDPKESGERKKLNFGHSIGHAVESLVLERGEERLLHGEAVAIGMICEAWISTQLLGLPVEHLESIVRNICEYFPLYSLAQVDEHRLLELMKHDKKNEKGEIRMALLSSIGKAVPATAVPQDVIVGAFNFYRSLQ